MSNPLTGDYEAALQIAIRQVNGLLGTLHQNGATQNAALQLLHSTPLRIADQLPPPGTTGVFADWVTKYQRATPGHGRDDPGARVDPADHVIPDVGYERVPGRVDGNWRWCATQHMLSGWNFRWLSDLTKDSVRYSSVPLPMEAAS